MSASELCFKTAIELTGLIRSGELSALDVLQAHLNHIEQVNPKVNAIVTLDADAAIERAKAADNRQASGEELGVLHGLPVAVKDLVATKGMRTTYGSPIFKDFVPEHDDLIVSRMKQAGAIVIGKTNTPEFGAGSQTFNEVFGETLNPYDLSKTCGGSSGGAAVALACGMIPIADGSDMGGSLRNPANFCNVVGFRTAAGRVPVWPEDVGWFPLAVQGPMARTVGDAALLLSAIAGYDNRSPIALLESGDQFREPLERQFGGSRIAWSRTLGDLPVDSAVTAAIDQKRDVFESLGCDVEDIDPDLSDADEIFKVLRAWRFELKFRSLMDKHHDQIKETIQWNVAQGKKLSGKDVSRVEEKRTRLYHRMRRFFDHYDFLIAPVSQVPPFDVRSQYVEEIEGVKMDTYIDWMKSCYYITATGLPAISVPCGFTPAGLPVGVQIVGPHLSEFNVLQLAEAFEHATGTGRTRPDWID